MGLSSMRCDLYLSYAVSILVIHNSKYNTGRRKFWLERKHSLKNFKTNFVIYEYDQNSFVFSLASYSHTHVGM